MRAAAEFAGTDRFRVIRRIGAGGMGVVYEAEDRERGERVALKTFRRADSDTLYRLKREFRTLADLSHPNLIALHELVVADECFFTMELLDGTDFLGYVRGPAGVARQVDPGAATDRMRPAGAGAGPDLASSPGAALRCDEARLRHALPQLARGLMALHAADQIHRDVKPSNILVTRDGRVVLVDFGLVTRADSTEPESQAGHIVGTVAYMAPEQCRGDARLTPAADWYGVGTLLYEALTGRLPFLGPMMRVLVEKQQRAPAPPHAIDPHVAKDLDELCSKLLEREPADRPDGVSVLRRLGIEPEGADALRAPVGTAVTRTRTAPFTGRDLELARLEQGLQVVAAGEAAALLVSGPSGIGKSTLVQRFLDRARARQADQVVLQGRCYERENVPYQAMDSLIDNLSRYWLALPPAEAGSLLPREAALLPRLFPVLGRVPVVAEAPRGRDLADPQELRTRAFGALREVLQRLGARHPLVLVLDDMQWVDPNTLTVLADLMRPPDPPCLLLVLSTRPEGSETLHRVMREMGTASDLIELAPLREGASTELAELLLGASDRAAEVAREAAGNPFFIGELVKYLQTVDRAALGAVRLDEVIAQRMSHLSETARKIIQLVALAGEPVTRGVLCRALGIPAADLTREAGILRTQHFIRAAGMRADDRLESYHDRLRDAALASLSGEATRALHRALALAHESVSDDPTEEQLTRHWLGAGETARAAEHARRAGDEALDRLDFDRAARYYRLALDLGHAEPAREAALRATLGETLSRAGRAAEAAEQFQSAAALHADPAASLDLRRSAAEELLRGGHLEQGMEAIRGVLADIGCRLATTSIAALASLLLRRAWLRLRGLRWRARPPSEILPRTQTKVDIYGSVAYGLSILDHIRGADYQARHLLLALRSGDAPRVGRALLFETGYLAAQASRRARPVALLARKVADDLQDAYLRAFAFAPEGLIAILVDTDWHLAIRTFHEAESQLRLLRTAGWEIDVAQQYSCLARKHTGDLRELARLVPLYLREAERRGDRYMIVNLRTHLNLTWLLDDDVAAADANLDDAMASWMPRARDTFQLQHLWALQGRCENALYRGDHAAAARLLADSAVPLRRSFLTLIPLVFCEMLSIRGRIALAEAAAGPVRGRGTSSRLARACARRLRRSRLPVARHWAVLLEAGIAGVERKSELAIAKLGIALEGLEASGNLLLAAAARRRLGEVRGGTDGDRLVAAADAWFTAQGVKNPARMTAMLAPGWPHPDRGPA